VRKVRESWRQSKLNATCNKCGAPVDIISTGNPYRKGIVSFRCINDSCSESTKWIPVVDEAIRKIIRSKSSGRSRSSKVLEQN
jgi:hypothetical protein